MQATIGQAAKRIAGPALQLDAHSQNASRDARDGRRLDL